MTYGLLAGGVVSQKGDVGAYRGRERRYQRFLDGDFETGNRSRELEAAWCRPTPWRSQGLKMRAKRISR